MKKNQAQDTHLEVKRLEAAIAQKLRLLVEENDVTGSLGAVLLSVFKDFRSYRERHNNTLESFKKISPECRVEQVQDCINKANELAIIQLSHLSEQIDDFREISAKYHLPKLQDFESLESCVNATCSFMRVWIDEAKQRRAVGEKSLLERIRELDHRKNATTLEDMRLSIIDIGIMISSQLCSYFLFINSISEERESLAANIRDVEALLGCLILEENKSGSSFVIDRFKSVVRLVKRVLNVGDYGNDDVDIDVWVESHLVTAILREVLRFEVALYCPDLPMMLTDEIFLGMAMHMRRVFERKLSLVRLELSLLNEKLEIGDEDPADIKTLLNFGIKKIWDEFDLNVIRS